MTSKADFKKQWEKNTPEERRERLNELGAMPERDDDLEREHDSLAEMVAVDEDEAAELAKEAEEA
jgi:hypothetical protein